MFHQQLSKSISFLQNVKALQYILQPPESKTEAAFTKLSLPMAFTYAVEALILLQAGEQG